MYLQICMLIYYVPTDLYAYGVKKIMEYKQQSPVTSEYNPVSTYTTLSGIQFTMPVHLDMTEFSARQDSLNKIQETFRKNLKLDEMAEAGLFFQGRNSKKLLD